MNKKVLVGLIALVAAAAAGIAIFAVMMNIPRNNPTAEIYQNGVLIKKVPLSVDAEFTVECEDGVNVVTVENGTVRVSYADCPDKVCVNRGAVSGGAVPIVCLPHKLEIRIVDGENNADA
ncbi:MAG: NusG domain II-containing protein [Oscillospiraceae bacterium]